MMRSAIAFLPPSMITFMNFDSSTLPYLGSGRISRLGTSRRRGMLLTSLLQLAPFPDTARANKNSHLLDPISGHFVRCAGQGTRTPLNENPKGLSLLGTLRAVLGTRLLAVFHALQVERTAH